MTNKEQYTYLIVYLPFTIFLLQNGVPKLRQSHIKPNDTVC